MVEKPKIKPPSHYAIIGRYILPPDIFPLLQKTERGAGGEIQLTDALRELARQGDFYGYVFEGRRYDAGEKLGYLKATVDYALKRPDLGPEFRAYLRGIFGNGKTTRDPRPAKRGAGARRRVRADR
ncbi:MAG: sugar phosphate nucleotidyltransferase, partial [Thermoanaerobaculia bacterium]